MACMERPTKAGAQRRPTVHGGLLQRVENLWKNHWKQKLSHEYPASTGWNGCFWQYTNFTFKNGIYRCKAHGRMLHGVGCHSCDVEKSSTSNFSQIWFVLWQCCWAVRGQWGGVGCGIYMRMYVHVMYVCITVCMYVDLWCIYMTLNVMYSCMSHVTKKGLLCLH